MNNPHCASRFGCADITAGWSCYRQTVSSRSSVPLVQVGRPCSGRKVRWIVDPELPAQHPHGSVPPGHAMNARPGRGRS